MPRKEKGHGDEFSLTDPRVLKHIKACFKDDLGDPLPEIRKDMILKFFTNNPHTSFYLVVVWYSRWGTLLAEKEFKLKFKAEGVVGIFPSLFLVGEEQFVSEGCQKGAVFICRKDDRSTESFSVCACSGVHEKRNAKRTWSGADGRHLNYVLQSECTLAFEFRRPFDGGVEKYEPDMPYEVVNRCADSSEEVKKLKKPRLADSVLPSPPRSVTITVLRGSYLMAADEEDSLSDPFVTVEFNGKRKKTGYSKDTLNPEWKEDNELTFEIKHPDRFVAQVTCNDRDSIRNDFIGESELVLAVMNPHKTSEVDIPLKHDKASAGYLTVRVSFAY